MQARLAHATDFAGFRTQARALLARGVPPQEVHWQFDADAELFDEAEAALARDEEARPQVPVPAAFLALCEAVVLHRDPQRFALLYRLLWRLQREPALRHDPLDADLLLARRMAKAVRRDSHKMHAFLRFRAVDDGAGAADPLHVAWFEPEHHIVEANGAWFRRRFASMRWAILSPQCSLHWDRTALTVGPPATRADAPAADAGEQLWLTYYRSIFNPARLKLAMMQKEMPRRYWRNLPEAASIWPLAAEARERSQRMIEQPATTPERRITLLPPRATLPVDGATLPALQAQVQACRRCPIGAAATQGVPGQGPMRARLMLVGEQPGDQEDLAGEPFVGPAGRLLDRALARAGIDRGTVFLTNAVRHFKYELRGRRRIHKTPTQQEALACSHWLEHEIALVEPGLLVALGATAARSLLGRPVAVQSERGRWHSRPDGRRVFVTAHPASMLRLPPADQEAAFGELAQDLAAAARG